MSSVVSESQEEFLATIERAVRSFYEQFCNTGHRSREWVMGRHAQVYIRMTERFMPSRQRVICLDLANIESREKGTAGLVISLLLELTVELGIGLYVENCMSPKMVHLCRKNKLAMAQNGAMGLPSFYMVPGGFGKFPPNFGETKSY